MTKGQEIKPQGLKKNAVSALTQVIASLGLAALGIASFKLLNPEGMAFFRQVYFTPFTISIGPTAAAHDYLRSLMFGAAASEQRKAEMRSLIVVNSLVSLLVILIVFGIVALDVNHLPFMEAMAVTLSVYVFSFRFVLLTRLEVMSRYTLAIIFANISSLTPYFAVVVFWLAQSPTMFFIGIVLFNAVNSIQTIYYIKRFSPGVVWSTFLTARPRFHFSFSKYSHNVLMSLCNILTFQGVEFFLYSVTRYDGPLVANYALAYTAAAMVRQLANTFLQPLQATARSNVNISVWRMALSTAAECIIILCLITATLITPTLFAFVFPKYPEAQVLVAPLLFGVMGTSTHQIYNVQLIIASRVRYLAWSQTAVAIVSLGSVWLLNGVMTLWQMSLLLSAVLWLRGVVITPLYARGHGFQTSPSLWLIRAVGSLLLFGLALAS